MRQFKSKDRVRVDGVHYAYYGTIVKVEPEEYTGDLVYMLKINRKIKGFTDEEYRRGNYRWEPECNLTTIRAKAVKKEKDALICLGDYEIIDPSSYDYTGCNPVIAEALKQGKHIKCVVSDNTLSNRMCTNSELVVVNYNPTDIYVYRTIGSRYRYAKPVKKVKTVTVVKPADEIVKILIKNKYKVVQSGWQAAESGIFWNTLMFEFCGKEPDHSRYKWEPEWLEEKAAE